MRMISKERVPNLEWTSFKYWSPFFADVLGMQSNDMKNKSIIYSK